MLNALKKILEIQELDMQLIRLMKLKKERQKELKRINRVKDDLHRQVETKEEQVLNLKKDIKILELEVEEVKEKIKKLEAQQSSIKKVDEFNALTQEVSTAEKQRHAKELALSELYDKLAAEEEIVKGFKESLEQTTESSKELEEEIFTSIRQINEEGHGIKKERDKMAKDADPGVLEIYERLLANKKNRVVVPIENRCCSGCHIMLTAQDENLVRKGERLIFCEHCSRIHYWQEREETESGEEAPAKRRRRPAKSAA